MKLSSPDFKNNGIIPSRYTCDGKNISPELHIADTPKGTKVFALIMEDPDVPKYIRSDGMWDHWVIWNIPADTAVIPEDTGSVGVRGKNTSGKIGYSGTCPPDREHRYFFKIFALNTVLGLNEGTTKQELLGAIKSHIIEKAELVARYARQ